jgi:hypothetical protein
MDKISLRAAFKSWISRYKVPIVVVRIVSILATVVVSEKVPEISENPAFCGKNCHIMRPYYDSWRTSSHNDVRCVECHYEPGLIGYLKGKLNGLMQFYSYETTVEEYSGNLYAKVMDKNCLLCHEQRIFSSSILFLGVNFTHKTHLLEQKRGIGLTCTSCHSMLVIGMSEHRSVTDPSCSQCHPNIVQSELGHIVVTTGTCFTCHFRDVKDNTSISGCPSCHGPPKQTHNNYTNFNHTTHIDQGYNCLTCHTELSTGASDIVPKNKCYSCHNVKERVDKYDDFNFVHKNHVTNNKIACYQCHPNVKHEPQIKPNLCAMCHSDCHQPKFCSDCHAEIVTGRKKI